MIHWQQWCNNAYSPRNYFFLFQFYSMRKHHNIYWNTSKSQVHSRNDALSLLTWFDWYGSGFWIMYSIHVIISHLSLYSWHACLLNIADTHWGLIKLKYLFVWFDRFVNSKNDSIDAGYKFRIEYNGIKFFFFISQMNINFENWIQWHRKHKRIRISHDFWSKLIHFPLIIHQLLRTDFVNLS